MVRTCGTTGEYSRRMLKMTVQQGRSERRAEAYPLGYVEGLNDARTTLAGLFSILLEAPQHFRWLTITHSTRSAFQTGR